MTENKDREAESEGAEATEEGASGSPDDTEANSDDEQPEIADNERADMPEDLAEVAADVEAEAGANSDTDDDQEDSDDASSEDTDASTSTSTGASNWGDLYCDTVVAGLNTVVEEYGHEDADPIDESLPRDLDLDHYVDEWMAQQGKAEMEPGEGIVVGTTVLALTVLTTKTDLPNQALNKAKSQSDDA